MKTTLTTRMTNYDDDDDDDTTLHKILMHNSSIAVFMQSAIDMYYTNAFLMEGSEETISCFPFSDHKLHVPTHRKSYYYHHYLNISLLLNSFLCSPTHLYKKNFKTDFSQPGKRKVKEPFSPLPNQRAQTKYDPPLVLL